MNSIFDRFGGPRRAMVIIVGAAAVGLIFFVAQWAGAPTWVPLATGVPLESVQQFTDKLDQAGIKSKLERGGSDVMVSVADLPKARVALARGGIPASGRPGMELFDQPSWGMTDFTQRINYRRALEGELERVVGKMRGVDGAQVHLVMHENDGFAAQERPTEASVVLKLKGEADAEVVKGIAHLVASSVDGLTSDHVTIVDDTGRMLSEAEESMSATSLTSHQLEVQQQIEEHARQKAEKIVAQMVGAANLRIQVSAAMSFDRVERTTASVDPDKQVVAAEQKAQIVPGTGQPGAGQSNTATTYENTRSTESFVSAPGTIKRLSVAVLVADRAPAAGSKAQPTPRTPQELEQIKALVKSAVGADSARGDVVTVSSVPSFASTTVAAAEAQKADLVKIVQTAQRPVLGLAGLVLIIVIALLSLKSLKSTGQGGNQMLALAGGGHGSSPVLSAPAGTPLALPTNTVRDKVASSIEQQPDTAARVVRAWLKEA